MSKNTIETKGTTASLNTEATTVRLIDMSEAVKSMAERGVAQARETYETMKSLADETSGAVEQSYSAASKGFTNLNQRMIDVARGNMNASFDYMQALSQVTSFSEAVDVQTQFASKQFEILRSQWTELSGLTTAVAQEAFSPLKDTMAKSFKQSA